MIPFSDDNEIDGEGRAVALKIRDFNHNFSLFNSFSATPPPLLTNTSSSPLSTRPPRPHQNPLPATTSPESAHRRRHRPAAWLIWFRWERECHRVAWSSCYKNQWLWALYCQQCFLLGLRARILSRVPWSYLPWCSCWQQEMNMLRFRDNSEVSLDLTALASGPGRIFGRLRWVGEAVPPRPSFAC